MNFELRILKECGSSFDAAMFFNTFFFHSKCDIMNFDCLKTVKKSLSNYFPSFTQSSLSTCIYIIVKISFESFLWRESIKLKFITNKMHFTQPSLSKYIFILKNIHINKCTQPILCYNSKFWSIIFFFKSQKFHTAKFVEILRNVLLKR